VFKIVATVLFLGNISFGETASETAFVEENGMAERAAALLGTDPEGLKAALICKTVEAAGESIQGSNNMDQATKVRDALAKALYDKLFEWLITVVNDALEAAQSVIAQEQDSSSGERLYIGVLDIYGFEIFDRNGFEQLCINYVNEQLQQIFIEQVLRAEQDEYAREGIQWKPIEFFNNKIVVDLIDSTRVCARSKNNKSSESPCVADLLAATGHLLHPQRRVRYNARCHRGRRRQVHRQGVCSSSARVCFLPLMSMSGQRRCRRPRTLHCLHWAVLRAALRGRRHVHGQELLRPQQGHHEHGRGGASAGFLAQTCQDVLPATRGWR
jgi:hypothetical protein